MMGLKGSFDDSEVAVGGFLGASNPRESRARAKERYLRHNSEVKVAVAPERLLSFELKDGWEPLCKFLGNEVSDVPFPAVNDRKEHVERVRRKQRAFVGVVLGKFARSATPWALGVGSIVVCYACLDAGNKRLGFQGSCGCSEDEHLSSHRGFCIQYHRGLI
ncbi:uncharacterized protein PpBr36_10290 [Pyricularia pennisetigena]|uniref:uncharacterized protein n=1 Tax=Pyricularia pennisetigena TaxID=1578925 RepID=UPI00114EDD4E|nr:uncharacterized protein PpBr36_10290 [Pyricularia pennisetigena]TLS21561.1 hypothetical protein PpBr36_10290 [Pyricularia pennisetigena]